MDADKAQRRAVARVRRLCKNAQLTNTVKDQCKREALAKDLLHAVGELQESLDDRNEVKSAEEWFTGMVLQVRDSAHRFAGQIMSVIESPEPSDQHSSAKIDSASLVAAQLRIPEMLALSMLAPTALERELRQVESIVSTDTRLLRAMLDATWDLQKPSNAPQLGWCILRVLYRGWDDQQSYDLILNFLILNIQEIATFLLAVVPFLFTDPSGERKPADAKVMIRPSKTSKQRRLPVDLSVSPSRKRHPLPDDSDFDFGVLLLAHVQRKPFAEMSDFEASDKPAASNTLRKRIYRLCNFFAGIGGNAKWIKNKKGKGYYLDPAVDWDVDPEVMKVLGVQRYARLSSLPSDRLDQFTADGDQLKHQNARRKLKKDRDDD